MKLCFELTMPGRGSWNGRWSGEKDRHIIIRTVDDKKGENLNGRSFCYRWPDGWTACVTVNAVKPKEAAMLKKKSRGFGGYDWMVDSIIRFGTITTCVVKKTKEKEERNNEAG